MVRSNHVGPDFFHTLGVPIVIGREFTDADTTTSQKVAVVNELFAEYFAASPPARMTMQVPLPKGLLFSIGCVAVVG